MYRSLTIVFGGLSLGEAAWIICYPLGGVLVTSVRAGTLSGWLLCHLVRDLEGYVRLCVRVFSAVSNQAFW